MPQQDTNVRTCSKMRRKQFKLPFLTLAVDLMMRHTLHREAENEKVVRCDHR